MCARFLAKNLKQTAVYWGNPQSDGSGGHTYDDPVEIDVRWQHKQELYVDTNGQEVKSAAIVYTDQDIDMDGYLFLGSLADLSSAEEGDPQTVDDAYRVGAFSKTPNLKATAFGRKVWLAL